MEVIVLIIALIMGIIAFNKLDAIMEWACYIHSRFTSFRLRKLTSNKAKTLQNESVADKRRAAEDLAKILRKIECAAKNGCSQLHAPFITAAAREELEARGFDISGTNIRW